MWQLFTLVAQNSLTLTLRQRPETPPTDDVYVDFRRLVLQEGIETLPTVPSLDEPTVKAITGVELEGVIAAVREQQGSSAIHRVMAGNADADLRRTIMEEFIGVPISTETILSVAGNWCLFCGMAEGTRPLPMEEFLGGVHISLLSYLRSDLHSELLLAVQSREDALQRLQGEALESIERSRLVLRDSFPVNEGLTPATRLLLLGSTLLIGSATAVFFLPADFWADSLAFLHPVAPLPLPPLEESALAVLVPDAWDELVLEWENARRLFAAATLRLLRFGWGFVTRPRP
jgi:hypothetical protein